MTSSGDRNNAHSTKNHFVKNNNKSVDLYKIDTSKINVLNTQAINQQRTNPASAFLWARKALKCAQEINYKKGIADACVALGIIHLSNFRHAI